MAESDYYYSDLDAPDCSLLDSDASPFHPTAKRYGNRASHYVKWSREEDEKLRDAAIKHENDWRVIAQYFPGKTTTSLKKRWDLKHNPATKRTKWTQEEDDLILKMKEELGGGFWKAISKSLPGRPADAVKNRYYSVLRRHQNKKNPPEQIQNGHIADPLPESNDSDVNNVSDEALFGILSLSAGEKNIEPAFINISKAERMQKVIMLQNTLVMLQLMLEKTKGEIVILTNEVNEHGIITEAVPLSQPHLN